MPKPLSPSRSKQNEINQNNLVVARTGGVCIEHRYEKTIDPEVDKCSECGMKILTPVQSSPSNNLKEEEKLVIFGWIVTILGIPTLADHTKYNELTDTLYKLAQDWRKKERNTVLNAVLDAPEMQDENPHWGACNNKQPSYECVCGKESKNELRSQLRSFMEGLKK